MLRKNFIIKKRLWKQTIWEFIIPVFFSYILSFAKADNSTSNIYVVLLIALAVPTAFQATCRFILMQMVVDKETKMRETLRIMSMKSAAYGLSYFLTQMIFIAIISALLTLTFALKEFIKTEYIAFFFIAMILNGISMTFFSMALTTIFSDSKISIQLGSLALTLPIALFIGLLNVDNTDPWRLYFGYFLSQFPTTVIAAEQSGNPIPNMNTLIAWAVLVL